MRIGKRFAINLEERPLPSDEDVERIVSERIIALLEARLRNRDRLQTERMQRFLPLVRSLGENEDEAGLLAMLLDDFYQETFHAPVVPPASEEETAPAAQAGGRPFRKSGDRPRRTRDKRRSGR